MKDLLEAEIQRARVRLTEIRSDVDSQLRESLESFSPVVEAMSQLEAELVKYGRFKFSISQRSILIQCPDGRYIQTISP